MVLQESPVLTKPVVLVGLMGCGKSAVGQRLAAALSVDFYDLDHEIEKKEQKTIKKIFSTKGEVYFRAKERQVMQSLLLHTRQCIIATGGGAFMDEEIRHAIKQWAISVWIKASLDILVARVSKKNTRPLLARGDKRLVLAELMKQRYPIYEYADIMVETAQKPHEYVVNNIIDKLHGSR